MALPLFDDVVVDAPLRGLARLRAGPRPRAAPAAGTPFELDDHRPKSHRPPTVARTGSPAYFAYWNAFRCGVDGQGPPGVEHDDVIARYVKDGYRLGRLCRPLPCMTPARDHV